MVIKSIIQERNLSLIPPHPSTITVKMQHPETTEQNNRLQLSVLVRILFQYLEKVNQPTLRLAKKILKDCERKRHKKDFKYDSLADAIEDRLRDAVGEAHWRHACAIQKRLEINRQSKRAKTL